MILWRGSRIGSGGLSLDGGRVATCVGCCPPLAGKNSWTIAEAAGDDTTCGEGRAAASFTRIGWRGGARVGAATVDHGQFCGLTKIKRWPLAIA